MGTEHETGVHAHDGLSVASGLLDRACVHGRFQPPHLGHEEYLRHALARCNELWIGLVTPPTRIAGDHRHGDSSNPLSHTERIDLFSTLLDNLGVSLEAVRFFEFPIDRPDEIPRVLPRSIPCLVTVYDDWNREKIRRLRTLGYVVEILYDRAPSEKRFSGTEVRRALRQNDESWIELVPEALVDPLIEMDLAGRLRRLALEPSNPGTRAL